MNSLLWYICIFSIGAHCCRFSTSYIVFLMARLVSGAGEASFISLAPPFIEDYVPAKSKTMWLSLFYLSIPVGGALGYAVSGPVAQHDAEVRADLDLDLDWGIGIG